MCMCESVYDKPECGSRMSAYYVSGHAYVHGCVYAQFWTSFGYSWRWDGGIHSFFTL